MQLLTLIIIHTAKTFQDIPKKSIIWSKGNPSIVKIRIMISIKKSSKEIYHFILNRFLPCHCLSPNFQTTNVRADASLLSCMVQGSFFFFSILLKPASYHKTHGISPQHKIQFTFYPSSFLP